VPIKRSTSNDFCTVLSPSTAPTVKSVRASIVANVKRSYEAILVANATTINKLQEISTNTGIVTYMSDEELAKILKVKRVVTNDWLADDEIAVFRNYGTIGTSSPSTIEDYEITTNTDWFEVIGFVGGDLYSPKSALWINAPAEGDEEPGTISIDLESVSFAAAGEAKQVIVTASDEFEIKSKPEWITAEIAGNLTTLTAADNDGEARTGNVVFALKDDAEVTATLAVTQVAGEQQE
jgi:hypothetical protein